MFDTLVNIRVRKGEESKFELVDPIFVKNFFSKTEISHIKKTKANGGTCILITNPKNWRCPPITPEPNPQNKHEWIEIIFSFMDITLNNDLVVLGKNDNSASFDISHFLLTQSLGVGNFVYVENNIFQLKQDLYNSLLL